MDNKKQAFSVSFDASEALIVAAVERKTHRYRKFSSQISAQDKDLKRQRVADAITPSYSVLRTGFDHFIHTH